MLWVTANHWIVDGYQKPHKPRGWIRQERKKSKSGDHNRLVSLALVDLHTKLRREVSPVEQYTIDCEYYLANF